MAYLNFESQYNKEPEITINTHSSIWESYDAIVVQIKKAMHNLNKESVKIAIECYPGVRLTELQKGIIEPLQPKLTVLADEFALTGVEIRSKFNFLITDDRVFGKMAAITLNDYYEADQVQKAQSLLQNQEGLTVVYGTGATLVSPDADLIIYADLARWEAQLRMRSTEQGNWRDDNHEEDMLRKYKRGYFLDWRAADRQKVALFDHIDFYLDTNQLNNPKMIEMTTLKDGLHQVTEQPFRLVPYFDPGVWGGQWMKEVCQLDPSKPNYAWSFDGVPEENSLYLNIQGTRVEVPAINAVLMYPRELLGERVFARYGAEFPIRFDFLDTFEGQNLSLQVHPLKQYIKDQFGMDYTQDESYYILDAKEGANVYLGTKTGTDSQAFIADLNRAERGEISFPAEKYVNIIPAKKHDHFLIPAGTIHCSGSDTMVLEISSTPYIFTFKLWDWDRLGLDGKPRPVHIAHGEKVIDWRRETEWVHDNLVNQFETIEETATVKHEKTGLHAFEPIETERVWFDDEVVLQTNGTVTMLNLVEGECIEVLSLDNSFTSMTIHYAETFIIPASVKEYRLKVKKGARCGVLKAHVGATAY